MSGTDRFIANSPMMLDHFPQAALPVPFEVHLTSALLAELVLPNFLEVCAKTNAKPLLIELAQGEHWQQAMTSKQINARNVTQAIDMAKHDAAAWASAGMPIRRIKIEVPLAFAPTCLPQTPWDFASYFEWHGKVSLIEADRLRMVGSEHGAHLSANALKNQADQRFLTLREYANETRFRERVTRLVAALQAGGWPILREQSELCVYDDNQQLDRGWLA